MSTRSSTIRTPNTTNMDQFAIWKKKVLSRKDKSNKGTIDKDILPLIKSINKNRRYCTTSSCSGRIVLLVEPKSGLKKDVRFLYETHKSTKTKAIKQALKKLPNESVWFRFEPLILHVGCRTITDAQALLTKAQHFFKHSGIMALNKHPIIEIRGSEFIEAIIAKNKKLIVPDSYLKKLISEANKKHKKNKERINRFTITENISN